MSTPGEGQREADLTPGERAACLMGVLFGVMIAGIVCLLADTFRWELL